MLANASEPLALEGDLMSFQGDRVIACSIVFIVACSTCLVLRFVSHHVGRRPSNLEDWLMVPAWVLMIALCANVICSKFAI
jgi:hypothetical protein